jgi:hypothetical protein
LNNRINTEFEKDVDRSNPALIYGTDPEFDREELINHENNIKNVQSPVLSTIAGNKFVLLVCEILSYLHHSLHYLICVLRIAQISSQKKWLFCVQSLADNILALVKNSKGNSQNLLRASKTLDENQIEE